MVSIYEFLLWGVYPYVAITIFILGLILRYNSDPYGWSSKSSEILEKRMLKWGSLMFHWGIIIVFLGHIAGLLIPLSFYYMLGFNLHEVHLLAFTLGSISGLITIIGLIILLIRRIIDKRVRMTSDLDDYFTLILLLVVMGAGLANTIGYRIVTGHLYDYEDTIGPYIRSLFVLRPDISIMASVPISYQIHVALGILFFAVFPFTRLVHMLSFPLAYLWRSYIVYRSPYNFKNLQSAIKRHKK